MKGVRLRIRGAVLERRHKEVNLHTLLSCAAAGALITAVCLLDLGILFSFKTQTPFLL